MVDGLIFGCSAIDPLLNRCNIAGVEYATVVGHRAKARLVTNAAIQLPVERVYFQCGIAVQLYSRDIGSSTVAPVAIRAEYRLHVRIIGDSRGENAGRLHYIFLIYTTSCSYYNSNHTGENQPGLR